MTRSLRILVSGGTGTLARLIAIGRWNDYLGHLMTPQAGNGVPTESPLPYAADNGAFAGFDESAFRAMLARLAAAPRKPLWVTAPDVVGDARATLDLWPGWSLEVGSYGLTPAFVLQDGQTIGRLPDARAWFIGGSTAFKESSKVWELVGHVKRRDPNCQVHMGRCNTKRRIRIAWEIGVDTIDGTGFSRWGDRRILNGVRWIKQCQAQGLLRELDRLGPVHEWLGG